MGKLRLSGSLDAAPAAASELFPLSSFTVPLAFLEIAKGYSVATGTLARTLNSPSAFVPLQGVGTTDAVTRGTFLYLKSNATIDLRITTDDGAGGSVVAVVPVAGFFALELGATKYLKLLEAQGAATLEYFVSGTL